MALTRRRRAACAIPQDVLLREGLTAGRAAAATAAAAASPRGVAAAAAAAAGGPPCAGDIADDELGAYLRTPEEIELTQLLAAHFGKGASAPAPSDDEGAPPFEDEGEEAGEAGGAPCEGALVAAGPAAG